MLATDLVKSGNETYVADSDDETANSGTITASGMPIKNANVFVFRNGAKLRTGIDYTLTSNTITLVPSATSPNDWAIYTGDVFEVQWIK